MDRIKTAKTSPKALKLSDLPTDLLEPITCQLHYLDVANLYFIGSKTLNVRLENGGVKELALQFWWKAKPFSLPPMFQSARLARFSLVDWCGDIERSAIMELLQALPRTLKEMKFEAKGAFPAIQKLLGQNGDLFPALETLEMQLGPEDTTERAVAPLWPRSLRSLTLKSSCASILPLYLSSLPSSLTILEGNFLEVVNEPPTTFPESLTSIELQLQYFTCDPVPLLPNGLKTLSLIVYHTSDTAAADLGVWALESIARLPRGITSLTWPVEIYTREALQSLPPQLEILTEGSIDPVDWPFLPAPMTYCSGCVYSSSSAGMDVLQRIPKGLSQYQLTLSALPHVKSASKSGVAVSVVDGSISDLKDEMHALSMERLPSCITGLDLDIPLEEFVYKVFPSNLTSLCLSSSVTVDEHCISALPKSLKILVLLMNDVSPTLWKFLPRELKDFTCNVPASELDVHSSSWLPRTMRQLIIINGRAKIPLEWYKGLPSELRSLSIPFACTLPPSVPNTPLPRLEFPQMLTSIYARLTHASSDAERYIRMIIASLPKSLESLSIASPAIRNARDGNSSTEPISMAMFPTRMTYLSLPVGIFLTK